MTVWIGRVRAHPLTEGNWTEGSAQGVRFVKRMALVNGETDTDGHCQLMQKRRKDDKLAGCKLCKVHSEPLHVLAIKYFSSCGVNIPARPNAFCFMFPLGGADAPTGSHKVNNPTEIANTLVLVSLHPNTGKQCHGLDRNQS